MFITPVSNLNFNSNNRIVYKNGKVLYKNKTNFFRNDLSWRAMVLFFADKYKTNKEVNVYNFACSDGSESYSFALALREFLGLEALKFFPIKASDIDTEIINSAKCGPHNISVTDLYRINSITKDNYGKYFHSTKPTDYNYYMGLVPKAPLNTYVEFTRGDVIDELDKLKSSNNIVFARNFWCYLNEFKRMHMIEKLSQKLDKTSCLVIGELEKGHKYNELLEQYGFREVGAANVYEKMD